MSQIEDLQDRAMLITGASSGIGAALARAFAAQGAQLALHFNSHESEARALADEIARNGSKPGRIGEAGDRVGAFLFLASIELSGFITGNIVHANGGLYMP
jgi:3-oxoacyl-[acyl-carrier protein] reductase